MKGISKPRVQGNISSGNPRKMYAEARDKLDEYEIFLINAQAAASKLAWVELQRVPVP